MIHLPSIGRFRIAYMHRRSKRDLYIRLGMHIASIAKAHYDINTHLKRKL